MGGSIGRSDQERAEDRARHQESADQRRRRREDEDFLMQMSTAEGRRFVHRLLSESGWDVTPFTGNSQTYFNEGRVSVGRFLYDQIERLCPEKWILMRAEARQLKEVDNVR